MNYLLTTYNTTNKLIVLPNCLYSKITYSQDRHEHWTRQVGRGHASSPLPRSDAMYKAISQVNRLPYSITQATSKGSFKKLLNRCLLGTDIHAI